MVPGARLRLAIAVVLGLGLMTAAGDATGAAQSAPPTVTLRVIVANTAEAADRLLQQVKSGESFAALAKTASTAPSAESGGWLGRLSVPELRPEVRRALEGVSPGQVTSVVRIPTGFAIFRVEEDEFPDRAIANVGGALASQGAVKYTYDVSGYSEARTALQSFEKKPNWNADPQSICDARTQSLKSMRASIEPYLGPAPAGAPYRSPLDVMQLFVGLGQLDAYEGHLDQTIARFQEAARIAATSVPSSALPMEEALGIAYLHKAGMDNNAYAVPGDLCLLGVTPTHVYADTADTKQAIEHFTRYLAQKPDELEVRWLLNVAYMTMGGYPGQVPPQYLVPPSAFQSAEDVGRFHDVATQAGLVNVASAGGVIVEDFRHNGRFDVVTSSLDSCGAMRYFGNNGDGTFTDRTAESGLASQLGGLNMVQGDYNNDGCQDILVLRGGWEGFPLRRSLLRNNCDGTFTDVTVAAGLGTPTTSQTAVWTDIDNDGFLDLFIGNESGPAQLFHNQHDGTFQDIAKAAGVGRSSFAKGVAAADYDNDRYPDLYVSNFGERNFLYHNNRNGTFTEFASAARVAGTPTGFATWFFDYDNDGLPNLFVTSYVTSIDEIIRDDLGMPHNATTMKLYRNLGDGTFRDVSATMGLNRVRMPMGSNFGDIDNDGYLDMYLGGGQPSYGALAGAVLLRNDAGRAFVDVTGSSGTGELHKGHGVAFVDLDNDGDEDIVFEVGGATPGDRHALRLFENPGAGNNWLALDLTGVKTNASAVGARITVTIQHQGQTRAIYRTVGSGSSFGASPLLQHIGLGPSAGMVDLDIWWPTSDTRQHFSNVATNQWLHVTEFADTYTRVTRPPVHLGGGGTRP